MRPLIDDIPSRLRYNYYVNHCEPEPDSTAYYTEPLIVKDNAEYTIIPRTIPGRTQSIISYHKDLTPYIHTKNMYARLIYNLFSEESNYDRGLDIIAHNRGLFTYKYSESITNDDECVPDSEGVKLRWAPNLSKLKLLFQLGFKKDNPLIKKCLEDNEYLGSVQYIYWEKVYKTHKPPLNGWSNVLDGTQKILEPFSPVLLVDFSIFVEPQSDFVEFELLYRRLVRLCRRQGIEIVIVDDLMGMFYEHIPRTYDAITKYFIPYYEDGLSSLTIQPDGEMLAAAEEELNL